MPQGPELAHATIILFGNGVNWCTSAGTDGLPSTKPHDVQVSHLKGNHETKEALVLELTISKEKGPFFLIKKMPFTSWGKEMTPLL